jgi:hypothetical protein
MGEKLSDEFSDIADTILLPALGKKIKDKFGIDISDKLPSLRAAKSTTRTTKSGAKKSSAKKSAAKRTGAKKSSAKKRTPVKRAAKKS